MHHQFDIGGRDAGAFDQRRQAALDRQRRIDGHARFLVAHQTAAGAVGQHEVGESAADIDADPTAMGSCMALLRRIASSATSQTARGGGGVGQQFGDARGRRCP